MTEPDVPSTRSDQEDTRSEGDGMPGWVKLFGVIALALVILVVVLMLVVGGEHGPGRHAAGPADARSASA